MRSLLREPLFHFLAAAVLLLGIDALNSLLRKPVIEISPAAVEARAEIEARILGRPLAAEEKAALPGRMLAEEVLFREAEKRGMVADNQVRDTLVAMMRSALKPVVGEPGADDLKRTLAGMPRDATTIPPQIGFEHVSYSSSAAAPPGLLESLRGGAPAPPGEPLGIARPFPPTYQPQVERLFGGDFARRAFALPTGRWEGPVISNRGAHFIRITMREPERPMPPEELEPLIKARWKREQEDAAISDAVRKLASSYDISLPAPAETGTQR